MANETHPAITAYSIAVAPDSSFINRANDLRIGATVKRHRHGKFNSALFRITA